VAYFLGHPVHTSLVCHIGNTTASYKTSTNEKEHHKNIYTKQNYDTTEH